MECALDSIEFVPSAAAHAVRWCRPAEIDSAELLEADRDFVRELAARGAPAHDPPR
jgi:hypothetical protein